MLESAPDVIGRFVNAAANRDFDAIGLCFTEDASVEDERDRNMTTRSRLSMANPWVKAATGWPRISRATFLEAKPTSNIGLAFATD